MSPANRSSSAIGAVHLPDHRLRQDLDEDRQRHSRRRLRAHGARGSDAPRPALRRHRARRLRLVRRRRDWQSLRLNLPDAPVHGIVVEERDLAIATHGRSFYVLDNIGALRQATPDDHDDAPARVRAGQPAARPRSQRDRRLLPGQRRRRGDDRVPRRAAARCCARSPARRRPTERRPPPGVDRTAVLRRRAGRASASPRA